MERGSVWKLCHDVFPTARCTLRTIDLKHTVHDPRLCVRKCRNNIASVRVGQSENHADMRHCTPLEVSIHSPSYFPLPSISTQNAHKGFFCQVAYYRAYRTTPSN